MKWMSELRLAVLARLGWKINRFEECVFESYGHAVQEGAGFRVENATVLLTTPRMYGGIPVEGPFPSNGTFTVEERHPPQWWTNLRSWFRRE